MLRIFESIEIVASEIESKISFSILNRITQCLSAPKSTKNNIILCSALLWDLKLRPSP